MRIHNSIQKNFAHTHEESLADHGRSQWLLVGVATPAAAARACLPSRLSGEEPADDAPLGEPTSQETAGTGEGADEGQGQDIASLPLPEGACAKNLLPLAEDNRWVCRQQSVPTDEDSSGDSPTPSPSPLFTFSWTATQVPE